MLVDAVCRDLVNKNFTYLVKIKGSGKQALRRPINLLDDLMHVYLVAFSFQAWRNVRQNTGPESK